MNNTTSPDFTKAKSCYIHGIYYIIPLGFFSAYSPAYLTTNEPLDWEISLTPNPKNVLTIAGSGDQALFYTLAGAKHIDTFDVSYCAHVVQDIKTTAIRNLPYNKYHGMLCHLHSTTDATQVKEIATILDQLPSDTLNFITQMRGHRLFDQGENPMISNNATNIENYYDKIRTYVPKSFNFIWSDTLNLHTKLTKKYDVINLSNVFDYLNNDEVHHTISSLYPFLNDNGCFIFCGHHINYDSELMIKKQFELNKQHLFGKATVLQKTK